MEDEQKIPLTTEQQFQIRLVADEILQMDVNQLRDSLLELHMLMYRRHNLYLQLLRAEWFTAD